MSASTIEKKTKEEERFIKVAPRTENVEADGDASGVKIMKTPALEETSSHSSDDALIDRDVLSDDPMEVSLRATNRIADETGRDLPDLGLTIVEAKRAIKDRHDRSRAQNADESTEQLACTGTGRARNILEAKEQIRARRDACSTAEREDGIRNNTSDILAEDQGALPLPTTMVEELAATESGCDVSDEVLPVRDVELLPESEEIDGVRAFLARTVVDATVVTVITSDNENEAMQNKRQKKALTCIGLCLLLVAVAVAVPVATLGGKTTEIASASPTPSPSAAALSLAPTSVAYLALVQCLIAVTDPEMFQSPTSPQYQAAEWLSNEDQYLVENELSCDEPKFLQRYALVTFYFSVGGPQWRGCGESDPACTFSSDKVGWLSNSDECDWFRLECNANKLLEIVDFSIEETSNVVALRGTLPPELTLLTELVQFKATGHALEGTISGLFTTWSKIEELDLSGNNFNGPILLLMDVEVPALRVINLHDNRFSGELPATIASLVHLEALRVDDNRLTGNIPTALGRPANLTTLYLNNNNFEGEIPNELYALANLTQLHVHNNALHGEISTRIGQLQNLYSLFMGFSQIGGSLPENLFTLEKLTKFSVENAKFTGQVSPNFANLTRLEIINLSKNEFTGPIPDFFYELDYLAELALHENQLTGVISADLCATTGTGYNDLKTVTVDCVIDCDCCEMWMECP